jgi:hypothetical protein
MNRTGERRRLAIKRETLRRLANGELTQVAGGHARVCTNDYSGCGGGPTGGCLSEECTVTLRCDTNCCF